MSDLPDNIPDMIAKHRQDVRNGTYTPNYQAAALGARDNRSEYEDGRELILKEGLIWLGAFLGAIVKMGFARDAYFKGDPVRIFWTNLNGETSFADIPTGAINNKDGMWILLRFADNAQARRIFDTGTELYTR